MARLGRIREDSTVPTTGWELYHLRPVGERSRGVAVLEVGDYTALSPMPG
jgi:hypothetical protein